MSIELPTASVTRARLVSGRLPTFQPVRFVLPLRLIVLTLVTRTSKISAIACLISVLLARLSTMNV